MRAVHSLYLLMVPVVVAGSFSCPQSAAAQSDRSSEISSSGWATQNGGTRGGSNAAASAVFTVSNAAALKSALKARRHGNGSVSALTDSAGT